MAPRRKYNLDDELEDLWTEDVEERFMNIMIDTNITTGESVSDEFVAMMEVPEWRIKLQLMFRRLFFLDLVKEQYYSLKERYNIFSRVMTHLRVKHNFLSNTMNVPYSIRGELSANIPDASRYFLTGERRWDLLKEVFSDSNATEEENDHILRDEEVTASDARDGDTIVLSDARHGDTIVLSDDISTEFPWSHQIFAQGTNLVAQDSYNGFSCASNNVNNVNSEDDLASHMYRQARASGSSKTGESSNVRSRNRPHGTR